MTAQRFNFTSSNLIPNESDTLEIDGFKVRATIYADDDAAPPWEREDGHGPVSDWRGNGLPGEFVLCRDRYAARYYDHAAALALALADGWGVKGGQLPDESAKDYAARAVQADFERLKAWCDDQWSYVGVAVTVSRGGVVLTGKYAHAVWGIESDCPDHVSEIATGLIGEAMAAARAKLAALNPSRKWER